MTRRSAGVGCLRFQAKQGVKRRLEFGMRGRQGKRGDAATGGQGDAERPRKIHESHELHECRKKTAVFLGNEECRTTNYSQKKSSTTKHTKHTKNRREPTVASDELVSMHYSRTTACHGYCNSCPAIFRVFRVFRGSLPICRTNLDPFVLDFGEAAEVDELERPEWPAKVARMSDELGRVQENDEGWKPAPRRG